MLIYAYSNKSYIATEQRLENNLQCRLIYGTTVSYNNAYKIELVYVIVVPPLTWSDMHVSCVVIFWFVVPSKLVENCWNIARSFI